MRAKPIIVAGAVVLLLATGTILLFRTPPIAVEVAPAREGLLQVTVDDQGETRSHDRFTVSAPVAGQLMRIELHDGDQVGENQTLARIAPLPLSQREFDELSARLAAAQAALREAQQQARVAGQNLDQATREHARAVQLVKQGFIAHQAAEQASAVQANAELLAGAAHFRSAAAAAEVQAAAAGLSAVRRGGGPKIVDVKAPLAARVLRIPDASARVVAAGTPLLVLGRVDRLEIVLQLLSSEAVKVSAGMPVLIDGWGGGNPLRAVVRLVEPFAVTKVSALGVEEKRTNVLADFVEGAGPLGDGYRVMGHIITWQREQALQVPIGSLFRCGERWCVFTVEADVARRRAVSPGHRSAAAVEILDGVQSGDLVVLYPPNELADGSRVRVAGR